MKKTAMLLLCLCLIIGLVACVKEGPSTGSTPDTSQTEPIMPENPTDPEDPADPDDPTKPTGKPGGPGGTSKPTETSKPSNPTDSTNSQDPDNPAVDFETAFEQISVYFIFRHLADGFYDCKINTRIKFCVMSVMIIRKICMAYKEKYGSINLENISEITRMYSSEIEYSEDNTSALIFEFESSI